MAGEGSIIIETFDACDSRNVCDSCGEPGGEEVTGSIGQANRPASILGIRGQGDEILLPFFLPPLRMKMRNLLSHPSKPDRNGGMGGGGKESFAHDWPFRYALKSEGIPLPTTD